MKAEPPDYVVKADEENTQLRIYQDPSGKYWAVVRAIVRGQRRCDACGYLWGSYANHAITYEERDNNGLAAMHWRDLESIDNPYIQAVRKRVKDKAIDFHNGPMKDCRSCRGEMPPDLGTD